MIKGFIVLLLHIYTYMIVYLKVKTVEAEVQPEHVQTLHVQDKTLLSLLMRL